MAELGVLALLPGATDTVSPALLLSTQAFFVSVLKQSCGRLSTCCPPPPECCSPRAP